MNKDITLTPAYGRDYKSKAAVEADLAANRDFVAQPGGRHANRDDLLAAGVHEVKVRSADLRKLWVVKVR